MSRPLVVFGVLAFLLFPMGSAAAEPPVEVTGQITDAAGVLDDGTADAEDAVQELAAEDDLDLYVVFVSSFDSADPGSWAESTAELSELDERDLLLAVAEDDASYEYGWWVDESFPLTEAGVQEIMTSEVEPRLAEGERSDAVVALASELQSLTEAESEAQDAEEAGAAPWSATTTILVVGAVAVVLLTAQLLSRRRSSTTPSE